MRAYLRLIDVLSLEGFVNPLLPPVGCAPALTVGGRSYVGSDFSGVDALAERRGAPTA